MCAHILLQKHGNQLAVEQPSTGGCWNPPKKLTHIQRQGRSCNETVGGAQSRSLCCDWGLRSGIGAVTKPVSVVEVFIPSHVMSWAEQLITYIAPQIVQRIFLCVSTGEAESERLLLISGPTGFRRLGEGQNCLEFQYYCILKTTFIKYYMEKCFSFISLNLIFNSYKMLSIWYVLRWPTWFRCDLLMSTSLRKCWVRLLADTCA